ncbi:MAG: hypothetical protein RIR26_960 [Pseudomonadota bacterium]|jgi:hypothetical protein
MRFVPLSLFISAVAGCGHMNSNDISSASERANDAHQLGASQSGLPASKATAALSEVAIMDGTDVAYKTILSSEIKTSNRSLFVDLSLECGLLTTTVVKSQKGIKDTSSASASVLARVLVDGKVISPGEITFCQRTQELSAQLSGILDQCTDSNGDGVIMSSECTFSDEEISLLLSTMNANSFNFVSDKLASGVHKVEVQARIFTSTSSQTGSAEARGLIGKGSMVVSTERL